METLASLPVDVLTADLRNPALGGQAVTADGTPFQRPSRAIYVGGGGTVVAVMYDGSVLTFVGVPTGTLLPIRATAIATSTATSMVALF
jgi:hypothetical protein